MSDPTTIPDADLPGYCWSHCRTERALFHEDHINRLLHLAGVEKRASAEWASYRPETLDPIIELAKDCMARGRTTGLYCVQHGGSPACEERNKQLGLTCPRCKDATVEEQITWQDSGF